MKPTLIISMFVMMLVGCSSNKSLEYKEKFTAEIRDDGSKMFNFALIASMQGDKPRNAQKPQRGSKQGQGKGPSNARKGNKQRSKASNKRDSISEDDIELLENKLEERLVKNQYCREGFITLETNHSRKILSIRGECNEGATEQDRSRFN